MDLLNISSQGSALEVLSNTAAAILQINADGVMSSTGDKISQQQQQQQQQQQAKEITKELPTKEFKMKRSEDRRKLAHSSSFRLQRNTNSPLLYEDRSNPETRIRPSNFIGNLSETTQVSAIDFRPIALPSGHLERSSTVNALGAYRGSPYDLNYQNANSNFNRRHSDPNESYNYFDFCDNDNDQPLDMSKKPNRENNNNSSMKCDINESNNDSNSSVTPISMVTNLITRSNSNTPTDSSDCSSPRAMELQQMMRPSVITCAPSSRAKIASPAKNCSQCLTRMNSNEHHKCLVNVRNDNFIGLKNNNNHNNSSSGKSGTLLSTATLTSLEMALPYKERTIHKTILTSGATDPVIDEHFRRSLGKEYEEIFNNKNCTSNKSNNGLNSPVNLIKDPTVVSMSVDDHFAKALGDTWHKLQVMKTIGESTNNTAK